MDDQKLVEALRANTRFARLEHHHECPSTQDLAAQDPMPGNSVHWADHQTRGRGRSDHVWQDEPGLDLAVTFRIEGFVPATPLALPIAVPLAIAQVIEPLVHDRVRIKWPNDILVGGRKVCGVLIDSLGGPAGAWLLGIGLNVNRVRFPPELEQLATSLALAGGRELERHELLLAMARSLDRVLEVAAGPGVETLLPGYRRMLGLQGRDVAVVTHTGSAQGVLRQLDFESLTFVDGRRFALGAVVALRDASSQ